MIKKYPDLILIIWETTSRRKDFNLGRLLYYRFNFKLYIFL